MDKPNANGHFDKLLLSFFVLFFAIAASLLSERFKDNNLAVAMMDNAKLFVGALLGFITGRAVQRSSDRAKADTPPPSPPEPPTVEPSPTEPVKEG